MPSCQLICGWAAGALPQARAVLRVNFFDLLAQEDDLDQVAALLVRQLPNVLVDEVGGCRGCSECSCSMATGAASHTDCASSKTCSMYVRAQAASAVRATRTSTCLLPTPAAKQGASARRCWALSCLRCALCADGVRAACPCASVETQSLGGTARPGVCQMHQRRHLHITAVPSRGLGCPQRAHAGASSSSRRPHCSCWGHSACWQPCARWCSRHQPGAGDAWWAPAERAGSGARCFRR